MDIDVAAGELVAFLGPNGAGKSTTLRMLTTLLPPTSGTAWVAGANIITEPALVRSRIGYIGQGNGAGHSFRVIDELVMQGRFYGMNSADALGRAAELIEEPGSHRSGETQGHHAFRRPASPTGRGPWSDALPRGCCSWTSRPPGWIRTTGRTSGSTSRDCAPSRSTTIVLTTHYLEEADAEAERVIVIDHGQIIADDTASQPQGDSGRRPDRRSWSTPADAARASAVVAGRGTRADDERNDRGEVSVSAGDSTKAGTLPPAAPRAGSRGVDVRAADVRVPTLDDVFLSLTGRSLREESEVAA